MRSIDLLLDDLLPSSSIRLGRLVLNAKIPDQDFCDPLSSRPLREEYNISHQKDFAETWKFSENSKLRSILTAILPISWGAQNEGITTLNASQITTYRLENSGVWFEEACAQPGIHAWLEDAMNNRKNIYLVVGFRIIEDVKLVRNVSGATTKGVAVTIPVLSPTTGISSVDTVLSSPESKVGVEGLRDVSYTQSRVFDAPGEFIFAVQYRKVKFRWLSSQTINKTALENTKWKASWSWRSISNVEDGGKDEDEDEDEDGEDEDDEEILEAYLADASDLETSEEEYSGDRVVHLTSTAHVKVPHLRECTSSSMDKGLEKGSESHIEQMS